MKKTCTRCKEEKEISFFGKAPRNISGLASHCKKCVSKANVANSKKPENKEKGRVKSQEYRKNNPESFKLGVKMSSYKKQGIIITKEEYQRKYDEQRGHCAICDCHRSTQKKDLSLDHCHTTKKIRGFLCDNCNTALGKFKDNTLLLSKAITYLLKNG